MDMDEVEWKDVQGLVRSGFPGLQHAAYIPLHFEPGPGSKAKDWIRALADRLTRVEHADREASEAENASADRPLRPRSAARINALVKEKRGRPLHAVNLALTASGLQALGVQGDELARFSLEFRQGMAPRPADGATPSRRSSILGDIGDNSPAYWDWGGWKQAKTIDGLLLLYATCGRSLQELIKSELALMEGAAESLGTFEARLYDDQKEHFGFFDGISQPIIEGSTRAGALDPKEARISVVKPGEFVLGYSNERDARITYSRGPGSRDLGRNGTYLVFRQLEQDVHAFDKFLSAAAKVVRDPLNLDGPDEPDLDEVNAAKEWVAARLVGRKRDGDPLIEAAAGSSAAAPPPSAASASQPTGAPAHPSGLPRPRNDFLYNFEDRLGLACPIGSHIRRANPRDSLGPDPDTALRLSKMHRIIRRGRLYGKRIFDRESSVGDEAPGERASDSRGLYFIALNADIAGQFEMIQHTWLNGTHFAGLFDEADPMGHYPGHEDCLTIQHRPINMRISAPKFITVRGGAYFFLPGIAALRSLA
jgi:Dyp-type peroxidase family